MAIKLAVSTLDDPTTYNETYQTFRGVDYTHSEVEVESYRAVDMRNFIMKNESNTKRFGWEEMYRFVGTDNQINGIWTLDSSLPKTDENGNILEYIQDSVVLAQVGKKFYIIEKFGEESEDNNILENIFNGNKNIKEVPFKEGANINVIDRKSEAYVGGNRLYILCGDLLVFGKWKQGDQWTGEEKYEIRRVYNDEDTYIPTFLTKIICEDSNYYNAEEIFQTNVPLDDRNIMTDRMKITLLGETEDSPKQDNLVYDISCGFKINSLLKVIANGQELSETVDYTYDSESSKITFIKNYVPPQSAVDNIEILFEYTNPSKNIITECQIGIIYGYDGLRDRLFLSGNEDYPNMLYYSAETNDSDESDFTYFSDTNFLKLGNTTNIIKGMYIQGDGTMLILKSPSSQEPTIYFIKANMVKATDYQGNELKDINGNSLYEEAYPVTIGSIGVGLKKKNGIYNLNGDPLMISDNGIYGIVLGENVASQQRYAKLRSRLIDNSITNILDLEETACICYKNKFYIADTTTGLCYIADARYPTKLNDDLSDTYQYEWWVWDSIYARLFFEYKEELYMATSNGQICKFKNLSYKDISYRKIDNGGIGYDANKKIFVINKDDNIIDFDSWKDYEKLHENDRITFNTKADIKCLLLDSNSIYTKDNEIYYEANLLNEEEKEKYIQVRSTLILMLTETIKEEDLANLDNFYTIYFDKINPIILTINTNEKYMISNLRFEEESIEKAKLIFKISRPEQLVNSLTKTDKYINIVNATNPFRISFDLPKELVIEDLQTEEGVLFERCFQDSLGYWYYTDDNGNGISLNTNQRPEFNYFHLSSYETNNKNVDIIDYNENIAMDFTSIDTPAVLKTNKQITAYFTTKWFNLGTDIYLKNLNDVYVVPDPIVENKVEFAFETRRRNDSFESYTGKTFNFNDLDFNNVSFATNQTPLVYHKRFKAKKFSHIRFIFRNSDDNNCKLARVTIEYSVNKKVKGEK